MVPSNPKLNVRRLYDRFDAPVTIFDCGKKCAPHNPSGKPFCCDICHAVPAAYHQEWDYLQRSTDLWHEWRGDECTQAESDSADLSAETPDHMRLLACKGPSLCQRPFRALSCRQFPFFPYVTSDYRFIGLSYEWEFENVCWVISNLSEVTATYREQFITTYDELFAQWQAELDSYYIHSEDMRIHFSGLRRRIPLLHRNGNFYLISPNSERMYRTTPQQLPRFGPYREKKP